MGRHTVKGQTARHESPELMKQIAFRKKQELEYSKTVISMAMHIIERILPPGGSVIVTLEHKPKVLLPNRPPSKVDYVIITRPSTVVALEAPVVKIEQEQEGKESTEETTETDGD